MCIEQKLKNFIWSSGEERLNGKFLSLVFRDFGVGAKFEQKIKSVYCV